MKATSAVITGDLIASTEATPGAIDRAMDVLSAAARDIATWLISDHTQVGDTHFTRFRGDGWQIYVSVARFGLRAALITYARLAAHPDLPATRIAVGQGPVDHIPGPGLSDAHGAAFAISGRELARFDRNTRLRIAGEHSKNNQIEPLQTAFIGLLDDRISDWTPEQAEAMALVLPPEAPAQNAIAATLGISPQALSYRLTGAKWPAIRRVLDAWETPRKPREGHQ
ncbi:MAG: hypothetical protein WBB85_20650 [Albidovulum sp.]|uniref:hypothetical protein n=1 Tax=Albidovulum sp. TaxID=1872424 RepID=UPI003C9E95C2